MKHSGCNNKYPQTKREKSGLFGPVRKPNCTRLLGGMQIVRPSRINIILGFSKNPTRIPINYKKWIFSLKPKQVSGNAERA